MPVASAPAETGTTRNGSSIAAGAFCWSPRRHGRPARGAIVAPGWRHAHQAPRSTADAPASVYDPHHVGGRHPGGGLPDLIITRPIRNLVQATERSRGGTCRSTSRPGQRRSRAAGGVVQPHLTGAAGAAAARGQLRSSAPSLSRGSPRRKTSAGAFRATTRQHRPSLTSLLLGLRGWKSAYLSTLHAEAQDLREIVGAILSEVHRLAWELRPSVLDDMGLAAALDRYVSDYRERHRIAADVITHGLEGQRLPPEVETTIYRIVQEALTNVVRHAQAANVSVMFDRRERKVLVVIEDDGVGFDPERAADGRRQRLGLYGMRERRAAGGKVSVESQPGRGTTLLSSYR